MQKDKINKIVKLLSSYKNSATIKHEHDTDSQESLLKIGIKYANGGSVIESGSYIRSSINKNPHSFIAHFNMAKLFLKKNNLRNAITALESSIMLKPGNMEILLFLAETHEKFGNIQVAKDYFFKISKKNPRLFEPYLGLARIFAKQKRWNDSINSLRKAKRIAPLEKVVFYDGGMIFLEKNDIDTALVYFLRAHKLDPDDKMINDMLNKFKTIKKIN